MVLSLQDGGCLYAHMMPTLQFADLHQSPPEEFITDVSTFVVCCVVL